MGTRAGVNRSELAFWAEGTQWNTDELEQMYCDYLHRCRLASIEPVGEARWANEVLGIDNETEADDSMYRFENGKLFKFCNKARAYVFCFSSPRAQTEEHAIYMYRSRLSDFDL